MSWLSGISVVCFMASYAVALVLEVSRMFFKSGVRGAAMLGFGMAGFFAHTVYLGQRVVAAEGLPLSSEFDWYLLAAWLLAGGYLYLTWQYPRTAVGLFGLPLILGLIAVAELVGDKHPFPQGQASQVWGMVHGVFLLSGTVAVLVGFAAGLMHLFQSNRLKHKRLPSQGLRLPSLERLEHTNARAILASCFLLAIGFLSGTILNMVNRVRRDDAALPWDDPVVLSSGGLLAWLVAAAVFSRLYKPARQGRKVAYLTVASFVFLVLAVAVRVALPTRHTGVPERSTNVPKKNAAQGVDLRTRIHHGVRRGIHHGGTENTETPEQFLETFGSVPPLCSPCLRGETSSLSGFKAATLGRAGGRMLR